MESVNLYQVSNSDESNAHVLLSQVSQMDTASYCGRKPTVVK